MAAPARALKLGVTLPTFRADAASVIARARAAEEAGLHGVFSFDHLWPMGQPGRPALSCLPVLAAVAAVTRRIRLGPLVARVGLLPDEVLVSSLLSLGEISGGRLIAGLGTGDAKSAEEHERNGLVFLGAADRLSSLSRTCHRLGDVGVEAWVGAGSAATDATAREAGVVLNLWDAKPDHLALEASRGPVTWGGPVRGDVEAAAGLLQSLAEAGASWVVWAWPSSLPAVVEAADAAGVELAR